MDISYNARYRQLAGAFSTRSYGVTEEYGGETGIVKSSGYGIITHNIPTINSEEPIIYIIMSKPFLHLTLLLFYTGNQQLQYFRQILVY